MGHLSNEERAFIRRMKKLHVLRVFSVNDMRQITKNGGVLITCSDGDVDISKYHSYAVSCRPHEVKIFGGTLNVCQEYKGYDVEEESVIIKNIVKGFQAKMTKTLFLDHHFPCGMAGQYKHGIEEVLCFAYLSSLRFCTDLGKKLNDMLPLELSLREEKIFDFFHVKWINKKGEEEQSMYIFDPDLYGEYLIRPQAEIGRF